MTEKEAFLLARGEFLQMYSNLEQSLTDLVAITLEVDSRISWSIIHRVSSTRSRYAIIEDIIKVKSPEFQKPWNVIQKWLTKVDTARNHIVHWMDIYKNGKFFLANPATYIDFESLKPGEPDNELKYYEEDIKSYRYQAFLAINVISQFTNSMKDASSPFRDKYLQLTNDQNLEEFHKLLRP